jgi:hypothetical protein
MPKSARQRAALHARRERGAVDQVGDDVGAPVGAGLGAAVVEGDQPGVVQPAESLHLTLLLQPHGDAVRPVELDRDATIGAQVTACMDDGGGACAEDAADGVAACEGCAACGELCVHIRPVPDLPPDYSGEFAAGPPTR